MSDWYNDRNRNWRQYDEEDDYEREHGQRAFDNRAWRNRYGREGSSFQGYGNQRPMGQRYDRGYEDDDQGYGGASGYSSHQGSDWDRGYGFDYTRGGGYNRAYDQGMGNYPRRYDPGYEEDEGYYGRSGGQGESGYGVYTRYGGQGEGYEGYGPTGYGRSVYGRERRGFGESRGRPGFGYNRGRMSGTYDYNRGMGRGYGQGRHERPNQGEERGYNYGRNLYERGEYSGLSRGMGSGWMDEDEYDYDYEEEYIPTSFTYTEYWLIPGPFTGSGPRGYQRSDERVHEEVCERLTQHGQLDASGLDVEVKNGEVYLRGEVDDRRAKRMAEDAIDDISGVKDIHNEIRVRGQESRTMGGGQSQMGSQSQMSSQSQMDSGSQGVQGQEAQQTGSQQEGSTGQSRKQRGRTQGGNDPTGPSSEMKG